MAYDERLAERVREQLGAEPDLTEMRMFGGLAFMIGGHMAVAVGGQGEIMVRVDPDRSESLVASGARPMEMRGRPMKGWLRVDRELIAGERELAEWVERGAGYARSLPAKAPDR